MQSSTDVALFMRSMEGGGAERVTANIAAGLAQVGLKVDLVMVTATGLYLQTLPDNVTIVDLAVTPCRRIGSWQMPTGLQALRSLFKLVQYLKRSRPRLLLSATHYLNEISVIAKRLAKVDTRVIVAEHTTLSLEAKQAGPRSARLIPLTTRLTYPLADGIVAVSQGVAKDLAAQTGLDARLINVLYNPVITPQLYLQAQISVNHAWLDDSRVPVIVASGRFVSQKDFPTLLKAFARVLQHCPVRLILLGDGPEKASLQALTRQLQIESTVCFPGFVDNPYAYMAKAAVFVSSSRWEGLPTVLIEALALDLPVVATHCPSGPAEILSDGKYGHLVPVGDVSELAAAMLDVLAGRRKTVPRSHIAQFTSQSAIARYIELFQQYQVLPLATADSLPLVENLTDTERVQVGYGSSC